MVGSWHARVRLEADPKFNDRCKKAYNDRKLDIFMDVVRAEAPELDEPNQKQLAKHIGEWAVKWDVPAHLAKRKAVAILDEDYQMQELVQNVISLKRRLDVAIQHEEDDPSEAGSRVVEAYERMWMKATTRLASFDAVANTEKERFLTAGPWQTEKQRIFRRLMYDYKGKGEIYIGLCDRLASVQAALGHLEEEGRMDTPQWREFNELHITITAQIQKHSESLKTENLETHVQEIGTSFLRLVEPLLANQPLLFDRIVDAIEGNAGNLAEGKVLRIPERVAS